MKGICKLCNNEKELIGRSHIFPDFMYTGIGDEINRLHIISSLNPLQKRKPEQSGAHERNILCKDCETKLSQLERYPNNNFYSKSYRISKENFEHVTNSDGGNIIRCKNIDYDKFKLFLESLIWRASISSHQLFKNFKLLSQEEEKLRNSLDSLNPLNEDDFVCFLYTYNDLEHVNTDLVIINPVKNGMGSFVINQFIYTVFIDKTEFVHSVKELILSKNNEMGIAKLPEGEWTKLRIKLVELILTNKKAITN